MLSLNYKEKAVFRKFRMKPSMLRLDELNILKDVISTEVGLRDDIRSKEVALDLAVKVEDATGKDQGSEQIKRELFSARKTYALFMSEFDDDKYNAQYIPLDRDGNIAEASEDILAPIDESETTVELVETTKGVFVKQDYDNWLANDKKSFDLGELIDGDV